jgi:hypothetical protein
MEFVKFGLIGGGVAWKYHQLGIRNIPKMRFKSLFDIDEKNGKRV